MMVETHVEEKDWNIVEKEAVQVTMAGKRATGMEEIELDFESEDAGVRVAEKSSKGFSTSVQ